jgi:hypothetical protein
MESRLDIARTAALRDDNPGQLLPASSAREVTVPAIGCRASRGRSGAWRPQT